MRLFENLTQLKQEKERSTYEVEMLKQRLQHGFLPEPLHSLQLPLPLSPSSSLDKITDPNIRQHVLARHTQTTEQTKSEMMALYIGVAEVKMQECQLQFDQNVAELRSADRQLSGTMVNIVKQRFKNIDERFQYLYKLKIRFLEEQTNRRKYKC